MDATKGALDVSDHQRSAGIRAGAFAAARAGDFFAAFNKTWQRHGGDRDGEAIVHSVAWPAENRRYRKNGDRAAGPSRAAIIIG